MNIAIIGAGLMGRLLTLFLHKSNSQQDSHNVFSTPTCANIKVTLFDKDTKQAHNSSAYAAAGLLTPLGESLHCEKSIVDMGFESLRLWPSLLKNIEAYTFFQQTGAIIVSHEQDKGDYQRFTRHIQNNYPDQKIQQINSVELTSLEPELARSFHQGLYLPQEGQIGNRRLLVALRQQLEKTQVNWLSECEVTAISPQQHGCNIEYQPCNGQPTKNKTTHSQHYDLVIDCRGTGASTLQAKTNNAALKDLRLVRGELFQLFAPDVNLSRPIRLMHPRYQLYIAPKQKGFYVVGATEIESSDNSRMTVRSSMELLSAAYSIHPGFAEANIRQHISQCRPAFSDNQPKINYHHNLLQVNGLYRHGFLIAPVILKQTLAFINNLASDSNTKMPYNHWINIEQDCMEQSHIEEGHIKKGNVEQHHKKGIYL